MGIVEVTVVALVAAAIGGIIVAWAARRQQRRDATYLARVEEMCDVYETSAINALERNRVLLDRNETLLAIVAHQATLLRAIRGESRNATPLKN